MRVTKNRKSVTQNPPPRHKISANCRPRRVEQGHCVLAVRDEELDTTLGRGAVPAAHALVAPQTRHARAVGGRGLRRDTAHFPRHGVQHQPALPRL